MLPLLPDIQSVACIGILLYVSIYLLFADLIPEPAIIVIHKTTSASSVVII
jgi:hypothetical protein